MATGDERSRTGLVSAQAVAVPAAREPEEKGLPLPGWLLKVYFIFPVILYIPDAIFNYYVYSDGVSTPAGDNIFLSVSQVALWGFLSVGIVGMAYLLSMLAPWHWSQGHRVQAFFCGLGVLVATAITTWNSLAFRSGNFQPFNTDKWVYSWWPELAANHVSLTMIFAAVAPPFWGLFWAIVQPTQSHKNLKHLEESHAERMLRLQQEAELKSLRAEANAKIRSAQLKGMAQTAAAAREQASAVASQWRRKSDGKDGVDENEQAGVTIAEGTGPGNILQMPSLNPGRPRELGAGRNPVMMNSVAPATPTAHAAPASGRAVPAQPALLRESDVQGVGGIPASDTGGMSWGVARAASTSPRLSADVAEAGELTGTTGPRPAVRRAADPSPLLRAMNELPSAWLRAVEEARKELNPSGAKKSIPAKELTALVAHKLNVDDSTASKIISRVREAQRAATR